MNLAPKNIIICNNSKGNYSMLVVFGSRAGTDPTSHGPTLGEGFLIQTICNGYTTF